MATWLYVTADLTLAIVIVIAWIIVYFAVAFIDDASNNVVVVTNFAIEGCPDIVVDVVIVSDIATVVVVDIKADDVFEFVYQIDEG